MPAFRAAIWYQSFKVRSEHPFCYITVRHGVVESKTDDEWHVDGFSTRVPHVPEQNYIWSSTDPTEYVNVNVDIPKDFDPLFHNVNKYLQEFVDPGWVRQCKPKTVYCLDPYMLHRRPKSAQGTTRTFFRISFVPVEINDINNTPNPRLPRLCNRDGVSFRDKLKTYGRE